MRYITEFLELANNQYFLTEVLPFWALFAIGMTAICIYYIRNNR